MFVCIASKGTGVNLLRLGVKRKRTKAQIQLEKEEELLRESVEEEKTKRIKELEEYLRIQQYEKEKNTKATEILSGFISKGKAQQLPDGNVVLVDAEDEGNFVQLDPEDIQWEDDVVNKHCRGTNRTNKMIGTIYKANMASNI